MRLLLVPLFAFVVIAPAVAQTREAQPANRLIVQVGVFNIRPDGSIGGYAVETGKDDNEQLAGGIATDGCKFGAGDSWLGAAMTILGPQFRTGGLDDGYPPCSPHARSSGRPWWARP